MMDLFGNEVQPPEKKKSGAKKSNPMIAAYGEYKPFRCKNCKYFYRKQYANGPGTDHLANWPACGKFEFSTIAEQGKARTKKQLRKLFGPTLSEQRFQAQEKKGVSQKKFSLALVDIRRVTNKKDFTRISERLIEIFR